MANYVSGTSPNGFALDIGQGGLAGQGELRGLNTSQLIQRMDHQHSLLNQDQPIVNSSAALTIVLLFVMTCIASFIADEAKVRRLSTLIDSLCIN